MEASAAAAPADAGEAQGAEQEQSQQQGALSPELAEQLGGVPSQLEQIREWMEQSQQQQAENAAPEGEEPAEADLSFLDPQDPAYDPNRAAQELLGVLEKQNQDAIKAAVTPLQERLAAQEAQREAELLTQEFPELADEKAQDALMATTRQWVEAAGLPPEAAGNMHVVRAVFMVGKAAELARQEETEADQQPAATLEGAGGASPGGTGGGLTAESILGPSAKRSVLPF